MTEVGVDTGYSPDPGTLRAPDVAVGNVPNEPGWVRGAPALAIEYADVGQDEAKLQEKIADLLDAGTQHLWVVRLAGPRRVEVYTAGGRVQTVLPGQTLSAPGVLKNVVPVEALYDRSAAERATLSNLLQRQGYEDLGAVLAEGRLDHARSSLRRVLARRGFTVTAAIDARISACSDVDALDRWLDRAVDAPSLDDVFSA